MLKIKKTAVFGGFLVLAEWAGFEPACRVSGNTISSRARYDHFDTTPCFALILYPIVFIFARIFSLSDEKIFFFFSRCFPLLSFGFIKVLFWVSFFH